MTTLTDLDAAAARIRGKVHRTALSASSFLSAQSGTRVSLKLELFQKTGSFKVRGVVNTLRQLAEAERARGVISMSAGNHAQALAWGATSLGMSSVIVMPTSAVPSKVAATRDYGGEVVLTAGDLLGTARELEERRGLTFIHPFDDLRVIAGQGTVGLEIVDDAPDVDVVLVACGGGGLLAGVAAAVKARRPDARVIGIEPEGSAVMSCSLAAGSPQRLEVNRTIADGLAPPFTGMNAFNHVNALVDQVITVSDAELLDGMRVLMERCKLFAEPSAGAAVSPLLTGRLAFPADSRVVAIVCGGNIDLARLCELIG
ncbi:MAG: pyridoxal-phosphate dependent enzyme [Gemmatimonadaceae bacterium]|nr:pyridoxal-phosphate dependent enzyme [Gemmatimonadaceae bacterium]